MLWVDSMAISPRLSGRAGHLEDLGVLEFHLGDRGGGNGRAGLGSEAVSSGAIVVKARAGTRRRLRRCWCAWSGGRLGSAAVGPVKSGTTAVVAAGAPSELRRQGGAVEDLRLRKGSISGRSPGGDAFRGDAAEAWMHSGPPGGESGAGRVGWRPRPRSTVATRVGGPDQRPNSTAIPSVVFDVPRSRNQSWKFWVLPAEIIEALLLMSVKSRV